MSKKYNSKLFLIGFFMNLFRKLPLFLIAAVLAIVGFHTPVCRYIAIGIAVLAFVWSLIQQLLIKYTVEHSDNPDFEPFADAMTSDHWREEVGKILEEKMREAPEDQESQDSPEENDKKPEE